MTNRDHPYSSKATEEVPVGGFRWTEAVVNDAYMRRSAGHLLVQANPDDEMRPVEIEESLFNEFANLATTESAILEFANRYGFIGKPSSGYPITTGYGIGREYNFQGEQLSDWEDEIVTMRRAIDLAAALKGKRRDRLETWIRISPPWVKYVDPELYDGEWVGVAATAISNSLDAHELFKAGRQLLELMINDELRKRTHVGIVIGENSSRQTIFTHGLLATMWLQLMNSVSEDAIGCCRSCGAPIVVQLGISRKRRRSRRTCSDACRKRLSRSQGTKKQPSGGSNGK